MPWKFRGRSRIRGRVPGIRAVEMSPLSLALFAPLIGEERYGSLLRVATRAREDLAGSSQDWEAKWLVAAVLRASRSAEAAVGTTTTFASTIGRSHLR
jgi:hypothetical protein